MENTLRVKDSEALPVVGLVAGESDAATMVGEAPANDARWFAVYTTSRHEKSVTRHFTQRDIESFLPLYKKMHRWAKRSLTSSALPLFPNYVFVHISARQRISVLAVPGVIGLVGSGHVPAPLPDEEIGSLRASLMAGTCQPHPYLVAGERVQIKAGVMAGIEGILVRKKNELRVVLSLHLIQRSVAVEVDAGDVEPIVSCRFQELKRPVGNKVRSLGSGNDSQGWLISRTAGSLRA